jgi:hypothetical protein
MADDKGDIIHPMMRDLEEYDATPNAAPQGSMIWRGTLPNRRAAQCDVVVM